MDHQSQKGFTLIEVMVALMVLSIGLGALLVATTENTRVYQQLQAHFIQNWVDIGATNLLKTNQLDVSLSRPYNAVSTIKGIKCYWQVKLIPTTIPMTYQAQILSRMTPSGPWEHRAVTFHYLKKSHESI